MLVDKARLVRNDTDMIIDLESTHFDTFGNQEQTAYNVHYGTTGYHPMVAFDGLTGDFLKAVLRSGNQYTYNGVKELLDPLLEHYNQTIPTTDILVRGDSGFVTTDVYDLCGTHENYYVIRLKANRNLYRLAEEFVFYDNNHPWNVHMDWMRAVAGRLEMRYRYSSTLVYNTFPWPESNEEQKNRIKSTAQGISDARSLYPESSLADLYDEVTMPVELRKAHQKNDKAVMEAYNMSVGDTTESDSVAMLLELYGKLVKRNKQNKG